MDVVTTTGEVALLSIYVALGFFGSGSKSALSDAEADQYGGHIGATSRCVEAAQELALAVTAIQSAWPDIEYPSVLAYEVAEDVGHQLRVGDQADNHRAETAQLLIAFFKPDARTNADVDAADLRKVLYSVLGLRGLG